MNPYLDVNPAVAQALAEGKPVVALESTIISHGMPYPQNVETALKVEEIIRQNGAVPATIAILGGRLKAGLSPAEIEYLGKQGQKVTKASRRDLSVLVAQGADGATTVATTMMIAHMAGIKLCLLYTSWMRHTSPWRSATFFSSSMASWLWSQAVLASL